MGVFLNPRMARMDANLIRAHQCPRVSHSRVFAPFAGNILEMRSACFHLDLFTIPSPRAITDQIRPAKALDMQGQLPMTIHNRYLSGLCSFAFVGLVIAADAAAAARQAAELTARHRAGQTLLTFKEIDPPITGESVSARELRSLRQKLDADRKVRYRIYRSDKPIRSLEGCALVAEVPPLTCWNADFYGISPRPEQLALRYVVEDGGPPLPSGTGVVAHNPDQAGSAYYAVTAVVDGEENTSIGESNSLQTPVRESVGQGEPVLQRIEKPEQFNYIADPTLHYYVRWESPPNCAARGKPYDYVVAVPPNVADPAPVGIHLHCWGANLNGGYGWWYKGDQGHMLIASNQIPYDWWTGYHELYFDGSPNEASWKRGVVRPYSQVRMLSFLDWVAMRWNVDLTRTHVAGNSMGGSGAPMLAIRFPDRIAWATAWVGVHIPAMTPHFKGSYERVYGAQAWDVKFEDGNSVWDHFSDAWYLRKYPTREIGLICYSNGKNDGAIGWPQAVEFYQALQETRRPHIFVWGQSGHGQRARLPVSLSDRQMPMNIRIDQSLPAFTACSLDDEPGGGDPNDGDAEGQVNLYLYWETENIVDKSDRWEMTVGLVDQAPQADCTVDVTPRRLQAFRPNAGTTVRWKNESMADGKTEQSGEISVGEWGLITLAGVRVGKGQNRLSLTIR
jgi:pimeloyl-ACP methyl ester carboxylesterase